MKNLFLILFFAIIALGADVKISQLPLGVASTTGVNDSFPYVASATNITKRLTVWDIVNIPTMTATFATKASPIFTGTVTAPTFIGSLTGNASTATALSSNPTDCSAGQYANAIAANGNLTCAQVSTSQLSGTFGVANGGTGLSSGTSGGILGFTASGTIASSVALTANQVVLGGGSGATPTALSAGTSGQYLKSNGSSAPSWTSFAPPTIQKFTSGSGTYTTPAGVVYLRVKVIGGGGGGASSGTGSLANGGAGNASTFGSSLLTANGGSFGTASLDGGAGGTATINSPAYGSTYIGGQGGGGQSTGGASSTNGGSGGTGGNSCVGGGGAAGKHTSGGVNASTNTGGGGGGGGSGTTGTQFTGGGGGAGGCLEAIIPSPSGTYSYAVGASSSGGVAGSSGNTGGGGAAGYIEVTEYYQ